jgi:hypothetical protein
MNNDANRAILYSIGLGPLSLTFTFTTCTNSHPHNSVPRIEEKVFSSHMALTLLKNTQFGHQFYLVFVPNFAAIVELTLC